MDTKPSRSGSTPMNDDHHDPKYYSDIARCIVPTCRKYRRDHKSINFMPIPKNLKELWCREFKINCPKRSLYICEEHINIQQDCIVKKDGKLSLKSTANLILNTSTHEELPSLTYQNLGTEGESDISPICLRKTDTGTQYEIFTKNKAVMIKPSSKSIGTTTIKIHNEPKTIVPTREEFASTSPSTSTVSTQMYTPSTCSVSEEDRIEVERDTSGRQHILNIIEKDPKSYIGIPHQFYWIISFISTQCAISSMDIIITLFKIKQNDAVQRISDHFNLCKATVLNVIQRTIPVLATYLQNFVYIPEKLSIKKNLPLAFKPRFSNVQFIIDCFEIEIQKPSDPLRQAQTWSQYKSCNTIKYLISCCPNGFICFISKGFGGRISDKAITEHSGFVDSLPSKSVILADRGFKGLEALLRQKNITLLRPPSVSANETLSKKDVITGKVIASLRIHVERVIRRVRVSLIETTFCDKSQTYLLHRRVRNN